MLEFRVATIDDLPLLLSLRLEVLRDTNKLPASAPLENVRENTLKFLRNDFDSQITILAYDGGAIVGCGSASLYSVFPTCDCPNGRKAYIMNMYTRKEYRRRGIASSILVKLIDCAKHDGVGLIALEATQTGRFLYEKHGFVSAENEMYLP